MAESASEASGPVIDALFETASGKAPFFIGKPSR